MDDVARLCPLLDEETRLCEALLDVLREQQRAVVALEPEAVLASVERRDAAQRALLGASAERQALVAALLARHGAAGAARELVPRLPLPTQPAVRGALRRLRAAARALQSLERQTTRLVDASLQHVRELLQALASQQPAARYGADAALAPVVAAERLTRRV